jgi:hypothetical protein
MTKSFFLIRTDLVVLIASAASGLLLLKSLAAVWAFTGNGKLHWQMGAGWCRGELTPLARSRR